MAPQMHLFVWLPTRTCNSQAGMLVPLRTESHKDVTSHHRCFISDMPRADPGGADSFALGSLGKKLWFRAAPAFGLGCKLLHHQQVTGATSHLPHSTWWPPVLFRTLFSPAFTLTSTLTQNAARPECNTNTVQQYHAYAKLFLLHPVLFYLFTEDFQTKLIKEISCCAILQYRGYERSMQPIQPTGLF